ncbi:STAS domain-containing protein [Balneolaceae bacterium YR4-1]|uniref:Anti-sigma factor antagonist n=1 Tax=Halalkalibaculum roseum TaxID=2709311 RepID=A0A6M1T1K9_9BACT|nr:STAS domain-containing protein [Halalkalibaculum roseum]NGP77996.1 STAS domain-containing protein [Halalkalibaculum roseum]
MNYSVNERYGCVVIDLNGKVMGGPDAETFRETLHNLIEEGKTNVVVDLSNVKFMNSSGLGILIGGLTTMRNAGGDLKICAATENIKSMLMVSQILKVFDHHDTLEGALEAYRE